MQRPPSSGLEASFLWSSHLVYSFPSALSIPVASLAESPHVQTRVNAVGECGRSLFLGPAHPGALCLPLQMTVLLPPKAPGALTSSRRIRRQPPGHSGSGWRSASQPRRTRWVFTTVQSRQGKGETEPKGTWRQLSTFSHRHSWGREEREQQS